LIAPETGGVGVEKIVSVLETVMSGLDMTLSVTAMDASTLEAVRLGGVCRNESA